MWSRWDMQETPPDILITNYSMLNIMMMRSIEDSIFEATRDWLASDQENQFFLIIDELHAYRGTPGTEVAYILRLLYSRLGLTADSPQLRILTTTASLDDSDEGRKFLREFFGRDNFEFIKTDLDRQLFPHVSRNGFVSDALRGLLLALAMAKLSNGRSPLPVRGHLFFHNLQNLWACTNPHCTDHNVVQELRTQDRMFPPVGAIHPHHSLSCSCGSRVLDLIVCEVCGEVFLGGYQTTRQIGRNKVEILTADQPDLEGIPDQVIQNQSHNNYRIFWPLP